MVERETLRDRRERKGERGFINVAELKSDGPELKPAASEYN